MTVIYQAWDPVFHHQMKHREESWKYDTQWSIFHELWGASYVDETLCRMLDITPQTKWFYKEKLRIQKWAFFHLISKQSLNIYFLCIFFQLLMSLRRSFQTLFFLMEKKQETLLHFNSCKPLTTWNHHRITELWFMFHWVFVPEPGKRFLLGIHVWKKKTYLMNFLVRVGFFVKSQERKGFYYKNCGHVHHYVHNYICVIFSF